MSAKKPEPLLWLDSARGVFLPRDFSTSFDNRAARVANVTDEQWAILEAGPDLTGNSDDYWEAWIEVGDNAVVTLNGVQHSVYHDTDCWLIPVGMEWDDATDWFVWPEQAT